MGITLGVLHEKITMKEGVISNVRNVDLSNLFDIYIVVGVLVTRSVQDPYNYVNAPGFFATSGDSVFTTSVSGT